MFHVDLRLSLVSFSKYISSIIAQGAIGVNVFFILSGFILFYNYYDKNINILEFTLKRLAKIYPVYLAGFFLSMLVVWIFNTEVKNYFEVMMMNLLLVQSYLPKFSMDWYGSSSWSISTEFFFYLCFPILLKFILKLTKKQALYVLAICFIGSCLPGILFNLKVINFQLHYTFPPSRVWEFIIGMLTAVLVIKHKLDINNLIIFLVILLSTLFFFTIGKDLEGYVIQNIIIVPLMVTFLISTVTRKKHILSFLGNRFFEYLGKISYSFYIFQIPIMLALEENLSLSPYRSQVTFCIIFVINLLGAILLYHLIESPFHQYLTKKIKHIIAHKNTSSA